MSWCAHPSTASDWQDSVCQFPCKDSSIEIKRSSWNECDGMELWAHIMLSTSEPSTLSHASGITQDAEDCRFEFNLWHLKEKKIIRKHVSHFLSLVRQIGILLILFLKYLAIQAIRERKHLFVITFLRCLDVHCQGWFLRHNPATWGLLFVLISMWQLRSLQRAS